MRSYVPVDMKEAAKAVVPSVYDWLADAFCVISLGVMAVKALTAYPALPDRIAVHFDFSGKPNGYGGKETIFMLPIAGIAISLLLAVVSRFPATFNFPVKVHDKNAVKQISIALRLLRLLRLELAAVFTYITFAMARPEPNLGAGFILAFLGVIFGTIAWYLYSAVRAR